MIDKFEDQLKSAVSQETKPSDLLAARIRKAALVARPVDVPATRQPSRIWMRRIAAVAAVAVFGFVAITAMQPTEPTDEAVWQTAAADMGVEDIYLWVQAEPEPAAQDEDTQADL